MGLASLALALVTVMMLLPLWISLLVRTYAWLATGCLLVFILCLGFYVTPAVLGGGKVIMVSSRIANDIELFFNWGAASALGVVLLVMTFGLILAESRIVQVEDVMRREA